MGGRAQNDNDIFRQGLEGLDSDDLEQSIINEQSGEFNTGQESILEAEVIDADVTQNEPESSQKKKKPKSKKPLYIVSSIIATGAVVALAVNSLSPPERSVVGGANIADYSNVLQEKPQEKVTSSLTITKQAPAVEPIQPVNPVVVTVKAVAPEISNQVAMEVKEPEMPVAVPVAPEVEQKAPVVKPTNPDSAVLKELSTIQAEMKSLRELMAKQNVVTKPSSTPRIVKKRTPIMGYAIGVIEILEDAVVFQDSLGEIHVIKIGEKYRKYGALKSVNSNKSSFITTRGLWRVKK